MSFGIAIFLAVIVYPVACVGFVWFLLMVAYTARR